MRKPVKFKRYSEGGTVPEDRDFKDTSATDDLEDTNVGGFVRDSEGNRVRSTSGYVTWGEGPSKRTRLSAADIKPAKEMSAPRMAAVDIKPAKGIDVPEPPKPNAGRTPAMPKIPEAPPQRAKVEMSDEDPYGTPSSPSNKLPPGPPPPVRPPPGPNRPVVITEGRRPSGDRMPRKPVPGNQPPRGEAAKLPAPAPTPAQLAANIDRLKAINLPLETVETLPPALMRAGTLMRAGVSGIRKLLGNDRTPQRPPEAKLELPAPKSNPALPAPKKTEAPALSAPKRSKEDAELANFRMKTKEREKVRKDQKPDRGEVTIGRKAKKRGESRTPPTETEFKRGGSVGASRRADGCAQRGKTRGRIS